MADIEAKTGLREGSGMFENWLAIMIRKGMFSDELVIVYSETSAFVPRNYVQGDVDAHGKVKVRVFRKDGTPWAVLPTDNGLTIPVNEADLTPA